MYMLPKIRDLTWASPYNRGGAPYTGAPIGQFLLGAPIQLYWPHTARFSSSGFSSLVFYRYLSVFLVKNVFPVSFGFSSELKNCLQNLKIFPSIKICPEVSKNVPFFKICSHFQIS